MIIAWYALGLSGLALAAVWLAVRITPLQPVSAAGQTVRVGAAPLGWSLSGPGRLDLFGQTLPTRPHFEGPIRPRLELTRIKEDAEVARLLRSGDHQRLTLEVGRKLASGWIRYGAWQTAVAAGLVALPLLAWTGLRRIPPGRTVLVLATGLALVTAVNTVGLHLLASDTPQVLREVRSLRDLVGASPSAPVPRAEGPPLGEVRAVALGDSTAAGTGNRPLPDPSDLDRACQRSADSYPEALARANDWKVLNLACSGATVRDGVLGVQILGERVAPPQFAQAQRATEAFAVMVSVGANDVRWSDLVQLCAISPSCDDRASTAFFQNRLARFALDYRTLLRRLGALPQHPSVLVNEYYDPFGPDVGCLSDEGLTRRKAEVLSSRLAALNTVLRQGAEAAGFTTVKPDFEGHRLCSAQPYVQGPADRAPLHPTAAGALALALSNQQALPADAHGPPAWSSFSD
ncbi:SGNH/GDSL hydrolase family protein [Streptomyces sp. 378]|uniref:SGNH/GDSL hydrolase family protein n=1 Tax=Streptomyces sp. 378 TaxID=3049412 RepID=UPI0024C3849D|nr:SGNH/GDSL hydrolase family protein [Streptomyces sp. 378]MDK1342354.1 SGNH/GDSL hydrolase family protein [Streptomyces sp. 378]